MWASIFAVIEAIPIVNKWLQKAYSAYVDYQISKNQGDLDDYYDERIVWLDAIKQAQREKDEQKVMRYSHALATGKLPEPGVSQANSERLSRL